MTAFPDLFSEGASQYAVARPSYPEPLFDFIAHRAPARQRAWDCGTGSGQAAASLAARFDEVAATDPSAEQISNALQRPTIGYSIQPAEHTSFPSAHFDAICVAQALHWFRLEEFFTEARRVARPGALFAAWGYSWFNVSPEFDAAFARTLLERIAPYWAPNNRLLWNAYADVDFPFERLETPPLAIKVEWTLPELLAYVGTWSAVRRCVTVEGAGALRRSQDLLAVEWGNPADARPIVMPLSVVMGHFQ